MGPTAPNFLIIGAAKSGTSSLAAYLQQHPQIFMPAMKEPNFHALAGQDLPPRGPAPPEVLMALLYNWSALSAEAYEALFAGAGDRAARGEASVRYLYFPQAAANIRRANPDMRLVAILRDPAGRVYSHYNMNRQKQLEPLGLSEALEAEPERIAEGWGWDWHYAAASRYAPQLQRYIDAFGREALSIHLYDDFVAQPLETIRAICRHLGVSEEFTPDMSRRGKVAYRPRSAWLDRICHWPHPVRTALGRAGLEPVIGPVLTRLGKLNYAPAPRLPAQARAELAARFRPDLSDLSDLLGRRLPWQA